MLCTYFAISQKQTSRQQLAMMRRIEDDDNEKKSKMSSIDLLFVVGSVIIIAVQVCFLSVIITFLFLYNILFSPLLCTQQQQ